MLELLGAMFKISFLLGMGMLVFILGASTFDKLVDVLATMLVNILAFIIRPFIRRHHEN